MQYYAAPMEGLTDRVWRQAQQKWFGPEGTAHRYYSPFLSPPENRVLAGDPAAAGQGRRAGCLDDR